MDAEAALLVLFSPTGAESEMVYCKYVKRL